MRIDPRHVVARPNWIWPSRQDACQTPSEWNLLGGGLGGRRVLLACLGERLNPGLALSFGISPLVVGLAVFAFGTSATEMAVSVQSAWSGQVDIAHDNVVGILTRSDILRALVNDPPLSLWA